MLPAAEKRERSSPLAAASSVRVQVPSTYWALEEFQAVVMSPSMVPTGRAPSMAASASACSATPEAAM